MHNVAKTWVPWVQFNN